MLSIEIAVAGTTQKPPKTRLGEADYDSAERQDSRNP
jgi:hypothetical protein